MATFAELYCARNRCPLPEFRRRIFWQTLHRRALPLAPLLLMSDYFSSDHTLIEACGRATQLQEVYDSVRDFPHHPKARNWLHRRAKFRVSARQVCVLANTLLPGLPRSKPSGTEWARQLPSASASAVPPVARPAA